VKAIVYSGHKLISTRNFHIYRSIWVKFSTGDLQVTPLRKGEFHEKLLNENHTLLNDTH